MTRDSDDGGRRTASRRGFISATAALGTVGLAGCGAPRAESAAGAEAAGGEAAAQQVEEWAGSDSTGVATDHPYTTPRTTIDLDERDGQITVSTTPCRHQLLGDESQGGPWELPEVWAWQTPDTDPSVPGPLLRVTEGTDLEITYDNSEHNRPHTFHVHGLSKSWMDDGVPTTTGQQVAPGEEYTYEISANQPGTHMYHCHYLTQGESPAVHGGRESDIPRHKPRSTPTPGYPL